MVKPLPDENTLGFPVWDPRVSVTFRWFSETSGD